jgi:hypothetical protein
MGMVTTAKPFLYLARFTKYHVTRKFFIALDPTAAIASTTPTANSTSSSGAVLGTYEGAACLNSAHIQLAILTLLQANQLSSDGLFNSIGKRAAFLAYHATLPTSKEMLAALTLHNDMLQEQRQWLKGE